MSEPLKKRPESDDPMELRGVVCDGDLELMMDCVIEEYVRTGWAVDQVMHLFDSPSYPLLHEFLRVRGAQAIRKKIVETTRRCGVFRFRTAEAPPEPELVQIDPASEGG
jgi:hypothetical protein